MPTFKLFLPFLGALLLTGCSVQQPSQPPAAAHRSGVVYGGEQPVTGSTIQLYATGSSGYGSAATPLLTKEVLTDANGYFDLDDLYTCPAGGLVYLTATGGSAGSSSTNPNLALLTTIGPCSTLSSSSFLTVDERTTVSGVSAFTGFITSLSAIGDVPASIQTYFPYYFLLSSYLVNPTNGSTPGENVPLNTTVPSLLINTLADVIASCVNSSGGVAGDSTPCGKLFTLTTSSGIAPPTNTVGALINLEKDLSLSANSAALFSLIVSGAPFQPQLSTAPVNFGVFLASTYQPFTTKDTQLEFPQTNIGSTSTPLTVTVTNSDGGPVGRPLVAQFFTATPFSLTTPSICPESNTQACTFSVAFTPTASNTPTAVLLISDPTFQSSQIEVYLSVTR